MNSRNSLSISWKFKLLLLSSLSLFQRELTGIANCNSSKNATKPCKIALNSFQSGNNSSFNRIIVASKGIDKNPSVINCAADSIIPKSHGTNDPIFGIIPKPAIMRLHGSSEPFTSVVIDPKAPYQSELKYWLNKTQTVTQFGRSDVRFNTDARLNTDAYSNSDLFLNSDARLNTDAYSNSDLFLNSDTRLNTDAYSNSDLFLNSDDSIKLIKNRLNSNTPILTLPIQIYIDTISKLPSANTSYYEIWIDRVITIKTKSELGAFYAGNTLFQLLEIHKLDKSLELSSNGTHNQEYEKLNGNHDSHPQNNEKLNHNGDALPQNDHNYYHPRNAHPQDSNHLYPTTQSYQLPNGFIKDSAALGYRGMHLDVSRHFFDISFIKTYIDVLALYKFNTFHWHLTDDQGWRIEIKKYPKLHEIGSYRRETMLGKNFQPYIGDQTPHKGYYTQEEIKEVIEYAQQRHINIIPEIEMPGHARAALAAYPQFSCKKLPLEPLTMWGVSEDVFCTSDSTFQFIYGILDEVMDLFPSKIIHIGGDEVPKNRWKECPTCQKNKIEHHLENEEELQSYFIKKIDQYITSKGREIMGWDEILEGGLSPNARVMSWRGTEGGITAAKQRHYVVMTPGSHCYFDHYQGERNQEPLAIGGFTPIEKVYEFEPIPTELEPQYIPFILGAQGNVWTEYMATPEHVLYMILPRASALSEVLWNVCTLPVAKRNFKNYQSRLMHHFDYYNRINWNYSRSIYQIRSEIFTDSNNIIHLRLESHFPERPIYYLYTPLTPGNFESNLSKKTKRSSSNTPAPPALGEGLTYTSSIAVKESCNIQAIVMSDEQLTPWYKSFYVNKATGKTINLRKNPSNRYNIGGSLTLVDGIVGITPWTSKEWIGFLGDTLDAVIDLQSKSNKANPLGTSSNTAHESTSISAANSSIATNLTTKTDSLIVYFLNAPESWIHLPNRIQVWGSKDGKRFKKIRQIKSNNYSDFQKHSGKFALKLKPNYRFIRLIADPQLSIPKGFPGANQAAWLFVSEIQIQ
jgi:hexosaminidase